MTLTLPAYTPSDWELILPGYPVIAANFRSVSYPDVLGSLPSESRWRLTYENMTNAEALALLLPWKATGCGMWPLDQLPAETAGGVDNVDFRKRLTGIRWAIEKEPVMQSVKNGRFTVTIELIHELNLEIGPSIENPVEPDEPVFGLNAAPREEELFDGPYVLGYYFSTDFDRQLTRIGIYKPRQSGVNQPSTQDHSVGIWDVTDYYAPVLIWQQDFPTSAACVADPTPTVAPYYCWFDIVNGPELGANVSYVVAATWNEKSPVIVPTNVVDVLVPGFKLNTTAATQQGAVTDMLIDLDSEWYYFPSESSFLLEKGFLTVNMVLSPIA
jgi:hypothetical protein